MPPSSFAGDMGVDAIVFFAPRIETGRVSSQQGIFTRREPPPEAIAAALHEGGWNGVAQGWWPALTSGYAGWHQTFRSRRALHGKVTIGVSRDCGGAVAHPSLTRNAVDPWFFMAVIRVDDGGPVLYNGSVGFALPDNRSSNGVPGPCPGIDVAAAAALGISCSHHFSTNLSARE